MWGRGGGKGCTSWLNTAMWGGGYPVPNLAMWVLVIWQGGRGWKQGNYINCHQSLTTKFPITWKDLQAGCYDFMGQIWPMGLGLNSPGLEDLFYKIPNSLLQDHSYIFIIMRSVMSLQVAASSILDNCVLGTL